MLKKCANELNSVRQTLRSCVNAIDFIYLMDNLKS